MIFKQGDIVDENILDFAKRIMQYSLKVVSFKYSKEDNQWAIKIALEGDLVITISYNWIQKYKFQTWIDPNDESEPPLVGEKFETPKETADYLKITDLYHKQIPGNVLTILYSLLKTRSYNDAVNELHKNEEVVLTDREMDVLGVKKMRAKIKGRYFGL